MKAKRFTPEQIIRIIKEAELGIRNIDICRKYGIAEQTFYKWKSKYGGMEVNDAIRLQYLESENRKLRVMVADLSLDNKILKALLGKNF